MKRIEIGKNKSIEIETMDHGIRVAHRNSNNVERMDFISDNDILKLLFYWTNEIAEF